MHVEMSGVELSNVYNQFHDPREGSCLLLLSIPLAADVIVDVISHFCSVGEDCFRFD